MIGAGTRIADDKIYPKQVQQLQILFKLLKLKNLNIFQAVIFLPSNYKAKGIMFCIIIIYCFGNILL